MPEPDEHTLTPELLVRAYTIGAFPMADSRHGPIRWYSPDPRALLPIDEGSFKVSRSLRNRIKSGCYTVTMDRAFERVIRACAEPRPGADETWISGPIIDAYNQLHRAGLAHSVEAWDADDNDPNAGPVGGLYGVALGGAFFGESMFHRATDASKVCLVKLVEHLRQRGFELLDVQFVNLHLQQFGVYEVSRDAYLDMLERALAKPVKW